MRVSNHSVHFENLAFFPSCIPHNMDYRQKMVLAPNKTHVKDDGDDDDDEDLEALRMAALQSLRPKDNMRTNSQPWQQTTMNTQQQIAQPHIFYKGQRPIKRPAYQARSFRQNGGIYFQSHLTNPNLIAIVPVEEDVVLPQSEPLKKFSDPESPSQNQASDESKFCRYRDDPSGSEEEDDGDRRVDTLVKTEIETTVEEKGCSEPGGEISDAENESTHDESPQRSEEDEKEEDDDDVLLMADLEEEDSLERLMDEMEKEMSVDKPTDVAEKRHSKRENRSARKDETNKKQKDGVKLEPRRINRSSSPTVPSPSVPSVFKSEPRPLSPYNSNRPVHRRRSLSPKQRSRKKSPRKSPRRSPRRSPPRQSKKSQRDGGGREPLRFRSPRKSPPRFSPRPRSPRLSPRRSPPRLSPRTSPYLRSPCRLPRSRSPRISPRPRSPRIMRSRSPRSPLRRTPVRLSPRKLSPRLLRSPKLSPRLRSPRLSPRRLSPRPRSPRISPRRMSPRGRSPRMSPRVSPRRLSPRTRSPRLTPPRRNSPRPRSPGISPHRSPWSSPRNSPRLSPRRRRSPKELSRKIRPRSITPSRQQSPISKRGSLPNLRAKISVDEPAKSKLKQKDDSHEKVPSEDTGKSIEGVNDPVLEARRRKFESTKPIDPVNANKKIKLSKKENKNEKSDLPDEIEINATNLRSEYKVAEEKVEEIEYEDVETDSYLGVDFEFEDLEESIEDSPAATIASAVNVCSEIEPAKLEREKPVKKKKKKDKELYQVHKSKGELPLSERIGKEKKCKKRKEVTADGPTEKTETLFEDLTVDEEEGDLRTELSRRRAERLNRTAPIHQQSVRLVQSAFKGVVSEVVKSNAKSSRKQLGKTDDKQNRKEVRRVTVLHRPVSDLRESEDETVVDSKVPVRFRLGLNKASQETRESKVSRKNSKRQSRKVKHTSNLSLTDEDRLC